MIDFHSHFFSYPFFEALAKLSPLPGGVDDKLKAVAEKAGLELPSQDVGAHLERWSAQWERHDVEHAVSFASLPEEVPALAEAAGKARGRLTPFALVNPTVDGAADKVDALLSGPFKGILLFPAMHRFDPGTDANAVLEVASAKGAIVVVHCGMLQVKLRDLLGIPRPYDFRYANPLNVTPAANAFREARFVIPHFGAGLFRETLMAGSLCRNLFVDTSSSNSWMATQESPLELMDVFRRTLGVFGSERVLFGTDSSTLPRGFRHDLVAAQRKALGRAGATAEDVERIFRGNARRLLGLA